MKIASLILFVSMFFGGFVYAESLLDRSQADSGMPLVSGQANIFAGSAGYETGTNITISYIISSIIQAFLGILGIIFLILIIYSGYNWMTAAGNEEKVTKAKQTLTRAVIGLIIIVCAYAITYFVFTNLPGGGGGGADVTQS